MVNFQHFCKFARSDTLKRGFKGAPLCRTLSNMQFGLSGMCDAYSRRMFCFVHKSHNIYRRDKRKSKGSVCKQYQNALNFVKMSSDSEPEQNSSGSESFTDFEEEIEGLVGAAVIDENAEVSEIDKLYMGEPLANEK